MLLQIFCGSCVRSAVFPPPPGRIPPAAPHGSEGGRPFAGVGRGRVHGGGAIRIERILNLAWIPIVRKRMYNNPIRDDAPIYAISARRPPMPKWDVGNTTGRTENGK